MKSQGVIAGAGTAGLPRRIERPRFLYFNGPSLIYAKKRGPDYCPFFVMWVDNAELMQKFGALPANKNS